MNVKNAFVFVALVLMCWFFIHTIAIVADGLRDDAIKSSVAVILGNKVNEDGSLSIRLQKRLEKGIALYKDSIAHFLLVSGGLGKEGFYEADKMAEYLRLNGIPNNRILVDNFGTTTAASARNVRKLIPAASSVIVVSQYYHITRTKLAFRRQGFQHVYGAHPFYFELRDFYAIFREFFGYYSYLFFIKK